MKIEAGIPSLQPLLAYATGDGRRRQRRSDDKPSPKAAAALGGPASTVTLSLELSVARMKELLLTEIGHELAEYVDDARFELEDAATIEYSVDATARRIVDFTTGLLGVHREQNRHLFEADVLDDFEELLRGALARGYESALSTMAAVGIEAQTWPLAEQTMALVGDELDVFFRGQRDGPAWPPLAKSA